jgi:hypothetical protein
MTLADEIQALYDELCADPGMGAAGDRFEGLIERVAEGEAARERMLERIGRLEAERDLYLGTLTFFGLVLDEMRNPKPKPEEGEPRRPSPSKCDGCDKPGVADKGLCVACLAVSEKRCPRCAGDKTQPHRYCVLR